MKNIKNLKPGSIIVCKKAITDEDGWEFFTETKKYVIFELTERTFGLLDNFNEKHILSVNWLSHFKKDKS